MAGNNKPRNAFLALTFEQKCEKILESDESWEFLRKVIKGEEVEAVVSKEGGVVYVPASAGDRIRALNFLADRAKGKPAQSVSVSGKDGGPLTINLVNYAGSK